MSIGTETAVQAIELEAFVEQIADLQQHFDKLQTRLEKGGKKVQISNQTMQRHDRTFAFLGSDSRAGRRIHPAVRS